MSRTLDQTDALDKILKQWKTVRPDLNAWPMAVIGRISRLERLIDKQMKPVCSRFGIERWGFDVLATLRRSGAPFALTPTQLYRSLMLTSGAITNRLDRLEAAKLLVRSNDPNDRRGVLVKLTDKGLKLIDEAVIVHMEVEARMLSQLSLKSQKELADLLRQVSYSIEIMTVEDVKERG